MSGGYTKLFSTITDSTIWQAPDSTRLVWITMLAMADQNGYVGASVPGLAARARVPLDDCLTALAFLAGPDEWSRTKEYEGRRITEADGGWVLLNHAKYRAIKDADERREQARLAMAKLRAERKGLTVSDVNHGESELTQAEAHTASEAATQEHADRAGVFEGQKPKQPDNHGKASELGAAVLALRNAGVKDATGTRPELVAALADGLTIAELVDIAGEKPGKPLAYMVKTARARRAETVSSPVAPKPTGAAMPQGVSPVVTGQEAKRREAEALAAMDAQLKDLGVERP